ncbi:hypothetical protein GCM10020000_70390 [Streptomyces olivoverticillatus]
MPGFVPGVVADGLPDERQHPGVLRHVVQDRRDQRFEDDDLQEPGEYGFVGQRVLADRVEPGEVGPEVVGERRDLRGAGDLVDDVEAEEGVVALVAVDAVGVEAGGGGQVHAAAASGDAFRGAVDHARLELGGEAEVVVEVPGQEGGAGGLGQLADAGVAAVGHQGGREEVPAGLQLAVERAAGCAPHGGPLVPVAAGPGRVHAARSTDRISASRATSTSVSPLPTRQDAS